MSVFNSTQSLSRGDMSEALKWRQRQSDSESDAEIPRQRRIRSLSLCSADTLSDDVVATLQPPSSSTSEHDKE